MADPYKDGLDAYNSGDYTTALRLWRPLAKQCNARAQFNLGLMYYKGRGITQDYGEATKWWRLAAEQGHATAQFNLGVMYEDGRGVPQDHAEAVKWHQFAAEQGHADAQHNLGVTYATGQGAQQDYVQAHMWFSLAGSRFPPDEDRDAVQSRDWVAAQMTPAQIAEAEKLAREWSPHGEQAE